MGRSHMKVVELKELKIPGFPKIARECLQHLQDPNVDLLRLIQILQRDTGLCSSILKLGNSTLFGIGKPTSDLKIAICRSGFTPLMQILISHTMESSFVFKETGFFSSHAFVRHSAFVGQIAWELCHKLGLSTVQDALVAGVLHDVGHAAQATLRPQEMEKLVAACQSKKLDFANTEIDFNGELTHGEIGEHIMRAWGLPETVQMLVRWHHEPFDKISAHKFPEDIEAKLLILQVADILAHRFGAGYENYQRDLRVPPKIIEKLKLNPESLLKAVEKAKEYLLSLGIS